MKCLSLSILNLGFAVLFCSVTQAAPASVDWPSRQSKVVCGGTVDGEELNVVVLTADGLMRAESHNTRMLIYMDLHKPGQLHLAISDSLTDAEYERRQAILSTLSPEDAELFKKITVTRLMEFYVGFTEGIADLRLTYADRMMSLSCQELGN